MDVLSEVTAQAEQVGSGVLQIVRLTVQDPSFWIGFVTIATFALGRFNERVIDDEELDPPLSARSFTSRFRYAISALVYSLTYLLGYGFLITVGSIPSFQPFLMSFFGQVQETQEFGSPAWASMIITVLAPTTPWLRNADQELRLWLQEFSSIPLKARNLAEEVIGLALRLEGSDKPLDDETVTDVEYFAIYERLSALKAGILRNASPGRAYRYRGFFAKNEPILESLQRRLELLREDHSDGSVSGLIQRAQLQSIVRRYARLLVAALLQIESYESHVRDTIRDVDGFEEFPPSEFRFTSNQVVIGGALLIATCVLIGPISVILFDYYIYPNMQEFDVAKFYSMLKYWLVTSVVLVFAFVLPLSLASAVNLWRLDVAGVHRRERQSDVVVLLFTFVMCLALAALPFFIVGVLTAGEKGAINLSLAAWGFVPATTAIIFLILSNETSHWRTIISLAIFGAAGGIVSYLVVFFQTLSAVAAMAEEHPGAKITTISELAFGGEVLKIATVGMIVSAIFGTTQLVLSRTGTREDAMLEPSPTTDR